MSHALLSSAGLLCMQGDEIATISIDNPEFEGVTVEEEPVQEESEQEEDEDEQQPGVLVGAVDTEASVAGAEGAEDAAEPEAAAAEPEAGAEGSGAEAAGDEDDDGFVKVSAVGDPCSCCWCTHGICQCMYVLPGAHATLLMYQSGHSTATEPCWVMLRHVGGHISQ